MDKQFIVSLQGRDYPTWPGVLSEAHERGLQSIVVDLIQVPTADNEHTAICRATVVMKDGSTFVDFGDANPRNTNARIATALIRMASTRAKGRALRDAINVGQTLVEELPDLDDAPAPRLTNGHAREGSSVRQAPRSASEPGARSTEHGAASSVHACQSCGEVLRPARVTYCENRLEGRMVCPVHEKG